MGPPDCGQTPHGAKIVCCNYSPMRARISPMVCIPQIRFFIVIVKYLQISLFVIYLFYGLLKAFVRLDQIRSERIRVLPYSSIALTRSCFIDFFIAIPPKNLCGTAANESYIPQSCSTAIACYP
jgi:hypothetical protein